MINQHVLDSGACITYIENYLDCIESLPNDLQRNISRMREFDVSYQALVREVGALINDNSAETLSTDTPNLEEPRILKKIQSILFSAQELGDQKLQVVQQLQDLIETRTRQLDNDHKSIDSTLLEADVMEPVIAKEQPNPPPQPPQSIHNTDRADRNSEREQRQSKRARRSRIDDNEPSTQPEPSRHYYQGYQAHHHHHHHHHHHDHAGSIPGPRMTATLPITKKNVNSVAKKKKRKSKQQRDCSSNRDEDQGIDPDEPTYCLCDQISYGEMICCDNDLCPIEWFHFSCVLLATKPKGKWFCPKCRGDRANVMKPKAQFLKELERYNREKEEKARNY